MDPIQKLKHLKQPEENLRKSSGLVSVMDSWQFVIYPNLIFVISTFITVFQSLMCLENFFENMGSGTREMAHQLRALATLAEDLDLVPSNHVVDQTI